MSDSAENLGDVRPLYLNGQWSRSGQPLVVTNPATGKPFARAATVVRDDVRRAIADAASAGPAWRALTGQQRGAFLRRAADVLASQTDEIAKTITLENGKPLAQSRGEVGMTVDHLQWFAEEARRTYGRVVPQQVANKRHLVLQQPVGVVGAIAPWNFPLVLAVRKVAPALAAGCPVLLKPASATPLSAVHLAEAFDEVGLPAGVFQTVAGSAQEIGAEFFANPNCRKVTFTGSTEVGRELMRRAAESVTNLSLELGGHAPLVVFDDANLEQAVQGAMIAKFRNTGQSCIAANRVYVQRGAYDQFVEAFARQATALKVGDGCEEGVDVGPLIDRAAVDHALRHINQAVEGGAKVVCGGKRIGSDDSAFLQPTILTNVAPDALCMREETFAPVVPVVPFEDEAEAIRLANHTEYGLAAYVFTQDINRAWRMAEALEAGTVGVNDAVPSTSQCPFGGFKQSGLGRELGSEGIEAYLETKHVSFGGVE